MTPPTPVSAVVLLAGADAAAVDSLLSATQILAEFGIRTERITVTPGGPMPSISGGVCAVIVASPDEALPAALAGHTNLPVVRVPIPGGGSHGAALLLDDEDNLPSGPTDAVFATMAIGEPGAKNAALFVVASLAVTHAGLRAAWVEFRARQTESVIQHPPLERKD